VALRQIEPNEDFTRDVFHIHVHEGVERLEQAADSDLKDHNDEANGEIEGATTFVEGMMSALDATRTALNTAQKSMKALDSLLINIYFGSHKMRITTLESLNFFWNNVPDTPCLVCGENFGTNGWPPVRTVSFAREDPESATHLPL
jgi:hypothetical protein